MSFRLLTLRPIAADSNARWYLAPAIGGAPPTPGVSIRNRGRAAPMAAMRSRDVQSRSATKRESFSLPQA